MNRDQQIVYYGHLALKAAGRVVKFGWRLTSRATQLAVRWVVHGRIRKHLH